MLICAYLILVLCTCTRCKLRNKVVRKFRFIGVARRDCKSRSFSEARIVFLWLLYIHFGQTNCHILKRKIAALVSLGMISRVRSCRSRWCCSFFVFEWWDFCGRRHARFKRPISKLFDETFLWFEPVRRDKSDRRGYQCSDQRSHRVPGANHLPQYHANVWGHKSNQYDQQAYVRYEFSDDRVHFRLTVASTFNYNYMDRCQNYESKSGIRRSNGQYNESYFKGIGKD